MSSKYKTQWKCMWNADYKLSYILSSSIQIFIFSGDSVLTGIGNEILNLLLLIFCFKLSPALQGKKHLSSSFSLAAFCKDIGGYCQNWLWGKIAKLRLAFTLISSESSVYFPPTPHSWEFAVYCPKKGAPLLGPLSSFSPSFHQNMLSDIFFVFFLSCLCSAGETKASQWVPGHFLATRRHLVIPGHLDVRSS